MKPKKQKKELKTSKPIALTDKEFRVFHQWWRTGWQIEANNFKCLESVFTYLAFQADAHWRRAVKKGEVVAEDISPGEGFLYLAFLARLLRDMKVRVTKKQLAEAFKKYEKEILGKVGTIEKTVHEGIAKFIEGFREDARKGKKQ